MTDVDLKEKTTQKLKRPSFYKVILINDDFTPMDFVVDILKTIFRKTESEANILMMDVHKLGAAVAGVYTYEIAETKAVQVQIEAKKNEHPLAVTIEPEQKEE